MSLLCDSKRQVKYFCQFQECENSCVKCSNCTKCQQRHQNCPFFIRSNEIIQKRDNTKNFRAIEENKQVIKNIQELEQSCKTIVKNLENQNVNWFGFPDFIKPFLTQQIKSKKGKELNIFLNNQVFVINNNIQEAVFQQILFAKEVLAKLKSNIQKLYVIDENLSKVQQNHKIFEHQIKNKDQANITQLRNKFVGLSQKIIFKSIEARNKIIFNSEQAKNNLKSIKNVEQIYAKEVWALIDTYFKRQNFEQARKQIDKYLNICSKDKLGQYSLQLSQEKQKYLTVIQFNIYKKTGDLKNALKQFQKLPIQNANDLIQLHNLLLQNGEFQKADQVLNKSTQKFPNSSYFLLKRSEKFQQKQQFQEAFQYLRQYINLQTQRNPFYYRKLGQMALKINDFNEAIHYFYQSTVIQNNDIKSLQSITNIYLCLGKNKLAMEYLNKMLKMLQKCSAQEDILRKIRCLNAVSSLISQAQERQKLLNESIKLSNKYKIFNYNANVQLAKLYLNEQSQKLYQQIDVCQSIYPNAQLQFEKGRLLMQKSQTLSVQILQKAEKSLTLAINLQYNYLQALYQRGKCYFWQGKYHQSLIDFQLIKSSNLTIDHQQMSELQYRIGKSLEKLQQFDKALQKYTQALKFQSNHKHSQYGLACVLKKLKRFDQALYQLNILINDQEYRVLILQHIGNIHEENSESLKSAEMINAKLHQALKFYKQAYNLSKDEYTKENYVRCLRQLGLVSKAKQIQQS